MKFQFDPRLNAGTAQFMRGLKLDRRIPLAQRAYEAAQARSISLEQARTHSHLDRFELGGNRFQIFPSEDYDNAELTALVVSHFGSVFKDQNIVTYFSQGANNTTFVTLKVARFGSGFSQSLYAPASKAAEVFNLNFQIYEDEDAIEMSHLSSSLLGKGGAALLALYNIAKQSGIRLIKYCVRDGNLPAKRFYAQMGFGVPTNPQCTEWEVKVGS